uniref:aECM cysteine-cradle domain-containing protein n=1 Tax=Plectus sambesii TaxID=2011161 RepID=A0A914WTG9_9BILA
MKAPTVSATKSTESKTSLKSGQSSSNIQGFDPFFQESSGSGQEPLRSPSIAKGSGEAVLIRKSVVISETGHIERPSSSYATYGRDPEIIEEIVSNSKAVTPTLKSKAFGNVFDSAEDKAAEEFDYGEEIDAESANAPVLTSPKVKSSASSAKKTRQNGSHGANRRPNRIRSGTNRYVPRARVFPSSQQEVQLSTASLRGAPAPVAYRLSPEHCDQIKNIAKMYGIVDVVNWIRHNCKFAQAYFPGYTCKQMNEYVASCY